MNKVKLPGGSPGTSRTWGGEPRRWSTTRAGAAVIIAAIALAVVAALAGLALGRSPIAGTERAEAQGAAVGAALAASSLGQVEAASEVLLPGVLRAEPWRWFRADGAGRAEAAVVTTAVSALLLLGYMAGKRRSRGRTAFRRDHLRRSMWWGYRLRSGGPGRGNDHVLRPDARVWWRYLAYAMTSSPEPANAFPAVPRRTHFGLARDACDRLAAVAAVWHARRMTPALHRVSLT